MSVTGKRFTHADRILDFLKNQNKPLTAYEILEVMREDGIRAATTVYRALDKLNERVSLFSEDAVLNKHFSLLDIDI